MRALTLIQSMGWAIVSAQPPRAKRIENRPKPLPAWMRGKRVLVAVHDGASWNQEYAETVARITGRRPAQGPAAIVGAMILTGYHHNGQYTQDPWYSGPFGYGIEWAAALREPIPCRGMMGWWRVPEVVAGYCVALVPPDHVVGLIHEAA